MNKKSILIFLAGFVSGVAAILLLGIGLSFFLLGPQLKMFEGEAAKASCQATAGAVNMGINTAYAESILRDPLPKYPAILDEEREGACKNCFAKVLDKPVQNASWAKTGALTYSCEAKGKTLNYTYNAESGELTEVF